MTKEELIELLVTIDDRETDIDSLMESALTETGYPEFCSRIGSGMKDPAVRLAVGNYIRGWLHGRGEVFDD